jgi:hypothetical protein
VGEVRCVYTAVEPFHTKLSLFTKTGSGQTREN